ncbi:MAG TPA: hypothetical protein DCP53_08535 [Elusimicrobia bacterium]|nr:hypothetical protein [Elusimicrobiota bacterium]
MISDQEIRYSAKLNGVAPRIVEKDYHIGLFLREIGKSKEKQYFIFKGGTALRKCFFKNYRFSEDIDFTVTKRALNNRRILIDIFNTLCNKCNKDFGTTFRFFNITTEREVYGQESYKTVIHYNGFEGIGKINIDMTFYEKVEIRPYTRQIKHLYSDKSDFGRTYLRVYRLEEIIAEKLRATAYIHYYPRNRDIYDIWYLSESAKLKHKQIAKVFIEKCNFKRIDPLLIEKIDNVYLEKFKKSWQAQIGHQINNLPDFSKIKREFLQFTRDIIRIIKGLK